MSETETIYKIMTRKYEVNESVEPMTECPECDSQYIDGPFGMGGSMRCLDCGRSFTDEAQEWCIGEREKQIHQMVYDER